MEYNFETNFELSFIEYLNEKNKETILLIHVIY
jgi:hypothetical protein